MKLKQEVPSYVNATGKLQRNIVSVPLLGSPFTTQIENVFPYVGACVNYINVGMSAPIYIYIYIYYYINMFVLEYIQYQKKSI